MPPSRLLPVAALAAVLAFPAAASPLDGQRAPASAAATKTVRIVDDSYSPKRLSVAKGTRIKWVWSRRNSNTHDVYLDRRPRGARRFHSPPASRSETFTRKLRKAGTYRILCTFHEGMTMRIGVGG